MWGRICASMRSRGALYVSSTMNIGRECTGSFVVQVAALMQKQRADIRPWIVPAFVAAMLVHSPARGETPSPEEPQGAAAPAATQPGQPPSPPKPERYQDGILIWQTPDEAQFPFLLKFNLNTQIRYLNTTDSEDSFTD